MDSARCNCRGNRQRTRPVRRRYFWNIRHLALSRTDDQGTRGRPIRVQWLNELPNEMPSGFDPTVDCGPNAPDCFPYNRIVTHVHGAHVKDDSDGYAGAWFTPDFALTGPGWLPSTYGPEGTYRYPMDQEAGTLWYHDHAMGVTHNNTQMGLAGFFPITDENEKALIAAKILPSGSHELGFALQDRRFDTHGQFAMPDYPIYDLTSPGCTLTLDGLADPATCRRLDWMKDPADGHLVPYVAGHPFLSYPINAGTSGAPFPAASTSLEYFGNMPVVNGVTYGRYDVEPRVYRMRFIGGADSRTWVLKLVSLGPQPAAGTVIPFWQIGSEQGFLNNPVSRDTIDLMPGERVDVLVDLTGITATTKLELRNIGPDDPYAGPASLLEAGYLPSEDIPVVMQFNGIAAVGTDDIVTPASATNLRPVVGSVVPLIPTPGVAVRNVSLVEIADSYGRTLPTIDARDFMEAGVPATEIVRLNDIEEWDIINTTVDAHPMHLHLVAFQVIGRQLIAPLSFVPAGTDVLNQIFTQASYQNDPAGSQVPPEAWEAGWKDTVDCPPGMVTRVRAKFDIAGERYVYHCHILSHEEHDMMRPLIVRDTSLAASFSGSGLWVRQLGNQMWAQVSQANPQSMAYSGPVLYADYGAGGIWRWDGSAWLLLSGSDPENMVVSGEWLYADYGGSGIWGWNGAAWSQLTGSNPGTMVAAGLMLYADFPGSGIWAWNGAAWNQVTGANPEAMVASGGVLYADFPGSGIWAWYGTFWSQITGAVPEIMVASGSMLFADYGTSGLWLWQGSSWSQPTGSNPQSMVATDSMLYAEFAGSGIWGWNGAGWSQLSGANPEIMLASGPTLFADYGTSGIWEWNGSSWVILTDSNPEIMAVSH